jgi:hypothetical protein
MSQTRIFRSYQWGGCIATMHGTAIRSTRCGPLARSGWKTAAWRLFCTHASTICFRLCDRPGLPRHVDRGAARRHRPVGDRFRGPAAAGFLAIRQWQMARGDVDSIRPQRLGYVLAIARGHADAASQRDRERRSGGCYPSGTPQACRSLCGVHGRGRRREGRSRRSTRCAAANSGSARLCRSLFSRNQQGTRRGHGRQHPGGLSRGHRDAGLDGP